MNKDRYEQMLIDIEYRKRLARIGSNQANKSEEQQLKEEIMKMKEKKENK